MNENAKTDVASKIIAHGIEFCGRLILMALYSHGDADEAYTEAKPVAPGKAQEGLHGAC